MDEFSLIATFAFGNSDTERWVANVREYIDQHPGCGVRYKSFPVDDEDEIRLESDLISLLLTPEQATFHPYPYDRPILSTALESSELNRPDGSDRLTEFIEIVTLVYNSTNPRYAFGMLSYQLDAIGIEIPSPITNETLADEQINHPAWVMLFPPNMVEAYGRKWLENLPADRIETLADGGLLIITTTDVTASSTVYESIQKIEQSFGYNG